MKRWKTAILALLLVSGALACFNRAEGGSKDARAYINQGIQYGKKGDLDKAIAAFNRALALEPQNWQAYHFRGFAYSKKGDSDQAIADYTRVLEIEPKFGYAHIGDPVGRPYKRMDSAHNQTNAHCLPLTAHGANTPGPACPLRPNET